MQKLVFIPFLCLGLTLGQTEPLEPAPQVPAADPDYSVAVRTFANVPVTFDLGSSSLFSPNLGGTIGVSFYPLPFILEGEGNVDINADIIYRRRRGPLSFIASAGPRYRVLSSDWLTANRSVGIYAGLGASAGVEFGATMFGADVLDAFSKVSLDYGAGLSEGSSRNLVTLRLAVGVRFPMLRLSASF